MLNSHLALLVLFGQLEAAAAGVHVQSCMNTKVLQTCSTNLSLQIVKEENVGPTALMLVALYRKGR